MTSGRADASTSTEDVKERPLCLFYFTHPFGVLSPEPPMVTVAPPHAARTFVNMQPVPPFWSSSSSPACDTSAASSEPGYDPGDAAVRRKPVNIVRDYGLDNRRQSVSSSFFSSDVWFSSSASSRKQEETRVIPYNRILPPLQIPTTRALVLDLDSPDDVWPKRSLHPGKFSLPPIEMPASSFICADDLFGEKVSGSESESVKRRERVSGVKKHRRRTRLGSVRETITRLMRRNIRGGGARGASAALRDSLRVLRDAWPEPTTLADRCKLRSGGCGRCGGCGGATPASGGASPGLLRRRYSMPETIMRKYRLAQQRSEEESEEGGRWSAVEGGGRGACAWCGSRVSAARREKEHMRKSALLRLWGRAGVSVVRTCPSAACGPGPGRPSAPVGTRSLDASQSELRASPRRPPVDTSCERRSDCSSTEFQSRPNVDRPHNSSPKLEGVTSSYIVRSPVDSLRLRIDDCSLSDLSDPLTSSPLTMKEIGFASSDPYGRDSTGEYIDGRVSERSINVENDEINIVPYTRPPTLETPSYDILEIVVSETLEVRPVPIAKNDSPEKFPPRLVKTQLDSIRTESNIAIDEYVSNILVESLNSLSDQIESMNASIGRDRKLNIVEKEIKVKLQNTGVNTIVHLSPTSNNQIIFGNEELYDSNERIDICNNGRDTCISNIREETINVEMNNNLTSAESLQDQDIDTYREQIKTEKFVNLPTENVNKSVLQQIQKLFIDELKHSEPEIKASEGPLGGISHIEISNVDVFIDDKGDKFEKDDIKAKDNLEILGAVRTCNYYQEINDTPVVPRFSAYPHTESMEVNTSSSEDAEILGSECTSLVDSLDDPNSPRSIFLRKSFNNKRSELVRSAIDVLDLLPDNANQNHNISPKEKGESFFVRIKDDDCDCEKENIIVADHMPETIKQKLYRRHRKRELRMECSRRSKVKQLKRDLDSNFIESQKFKNEVERESVLLINSLIDDVILKIAQDEYKYMRIKIKANKMSAVKTDENVLKKLWTKDNENNNNNNNRESKRTNKTNVSQLYSDDNNQRHDKYVRGGLSSHAQSSSSPEDSPPTRIYQKSEIHDGNKCIEILEILDYANSSRNSETTNSDENHNLSVKSRKSRIPIPVNEKVHKIPKHRTQKSSKTNGSRRASPILSDDRNRKSSQLLANILLSALVDTSEVNESPSQVQSLMRRASVPCEARSRSNSLRFKNVFDIIPEEKNSLSFESTGEDSAYNRRASAPSFGEFDSANEHEIRQQTSKSKDPRPICRKICYADTRSAGTSPMPEACKQIAQMNVGAMTSPHVKSAGNSPIRVASSASSGTGSQQRASASGPRQISGPFAHRPQLSKLEEGSNARRKSISTQHELTRRLRGGHDKTDTELSIFRLKRGKESNGNETTGSNSMENTRRLFEDVASIGVQERKKERTRIKEMLGVGRRRKSEAKAEVQIEKERRRRREAQVEGEEELEEEWSSSESSGSLLCSLAPAWLTARRRRRRAAPSGEWAVTVAGSCPSALPNDVEMRLRFPERRRVSVASSTISGRSPYLTHPSQKSITQPVSERAMECEEGGGGVGVGRRGRAGDAGRVTLTLKKEASDSSILASKSIKKSSDLLPDVHTYRSSRSDTRSSLKTRRGHSLHCWLPEEDSAPIRPRDGLAVEGNAIVPRHKPRAPSMSERDLTRHPPHTRHHTHHSHHSHHSHHPHHPHHPHHSRATAHEHLLHSRSFLPTNLRNVL